jgi:hypothetical protein
MATKTKEKPSLLPIADETDTRGAALTIACWLILALLIVVCLWLGADELRAYARSQGRFKVNMEQVEWEPEPWMGPIIEHDLRRVRMAFNGRNIFEKTLTQEFYERHQACPWVREVRYVRKVYPNRLFASVDIRAPAARVQTPAGDPAYVLTCSEGMRLPNRGYCADRFRYRLPLVVGCGAPAPPVGTMYKSADVLGGIRMAVELRNWKAMRKAGVTAVDVSNYKGRVAPTESQIVLLTEKRTRIWWGAAPREERFEQGEAKTGHKIALIELEIKKRGSLDECAIVDVRYGDYKRAEVVLRRDLRPR